MSKIRTLSTGVLSAVGLTLAGIVVAPAIAFANPGPAVGPPRPGPGAPVHPGHPAPAHPGGPGAPIPPRPEVPVNPVRPPIHPVYHYGADLAHPVWSATHPIWALTP